MKLLCQEEERVISGTKQRQHLPQHTATGTPPVCLRRVSLAKGFGESFRERFVEQPMDLAPKRLGKEL